MTDRQNVTTQTDRQNVTTGGLIDPAEQNRTLQPADAPNTRRAAPKLAGAKPPPQHTQPTRPGTGGQNRTLQPADAPNTRRGFCMDELAH